MTDRSDPADDGVSIDPQAAAKADAIYHQTQFVAGAEAIVPIIAMGLDGAGVEPTPSAVAQVLLVALNLVAARAPGGQAEAIAILDQAKRQAITSLRILEGKPVRGVGLILPNP